MTDVLYTKLAQQGFEQYEVSNFARAGHRCRHNCAYWDHVPYIGLGCAAHSYLHPQRRRNVDDVNEYGVLVNSGNFPVADEELIDATTLAREMAFLRLRTADGLNEEMFREKTSMDFTTWAGAERLRRFAGERLLIHQPPWWRPSRRGMLCADYIARELF
jgi:oxygen-independent coproporphyrinogen-3 oxidase